MVDRVSLERGIGGEISRLLSDKSGIDLRGIIDTEPFLYLEEIREEAERRGSLEKISGILEKGERRSRCNQYELLRSELLDDISKISSVIGHKEKKGKSALQEALGE